MSQGSFLILFLIACIFLGWLHEQIGWLGIVIIVAVICAAWFFSIKKRDQIDHQKFNELVLYILHNRISPDEMRNMNRSLMRSNFDRSALIRCLQIMRDSIEICLTSKKRDTAESRFHTMLEKYNDISRQHVQLVTPETFEEITRVVRKTEHDFHTKLYLNLASGFLEKAEKLKTQKSQMKYLNLAKDILREGIEAGKGNKENLNTALTEIEQTERRLTAINI